MKLQMRSQFVSKTSAGFLIAVSLATGCSSSAPKNLYREPTAEPASLSELIQKISKDIDQTTPDATSCDRYWNGNASRLIQSDSSKINAAEIKSNGKQLVAEVFQARLAVRQKLKQWYSNSNEIPRSCVGGARALLRSLRFIEEYMAEFISKPILKNQAWPKTSMFQGEFPYTVVNSDAPESPFDVYRGLRSGDVLMSRGDAFTSAAIARMGDVDGQFSHVAFYYVDRDTQQGFVTEAHIEVGVIVRPLSEYLKDGNLRVVVYRNWENPELAHLAAKAMHDRAVHASATTGNIPYNFSMDLSKKDSLMCTQVAYQGFLDASHGEYKIPLFMSRLTPNNRDFLDRLGIEVKESFLPIDMEVDPRFDVVMEWRNLSKANDLRMFDAMLVEFFKWSEDLGYKLQPHPLYRPASKFLTTARQWPLFGRLLEKEFPENMSPLVLETIAVMNDVSKKLYARLSKENYKQMKKTGVPMTLSEMKQVLNRYREQDFEAYTKFKAWYKIKFEGKRLPTAPPKSDFHEDFHP